MFVSDRRVSVYLCAIKNALELEHRRTLTKAQINTDNIQYSIFILPQK
jgi:hypothetical protein